MKYTKETIKACADWVSVNGLIEFGGAKLKDFCNKFNIDDTTYYRWMKKTEFSEAIKEAMNVFKSNLEHDLVLSLANLAKGYTWTRRKTEFKETASGQPKIAKQTTEECHVPSNLGAIIFLLTNLAPDKWKNRTSADERKELTIKNDNQQIELLEDIPDDVIAELAEQLQDTINKSKAQRMADESNEADIIEELAEAVE